MPKIICSEFVKRQTKESRFSHSDYTWEEIAEMAMSEFGEAVDGYREGVCLVPTVSGDNFYCAVGKVEDVVEWEEVYEARQDGETKVRTKYGIVDKKPEASHVDLVLYHVDVLAEEEDYIRHGDHEWEVISINARTTEDPYPIPPMTMARNFLVKKGGTKAEYTAQEFADSIWFWNRHCLVKERS